MSNVCDDLHRALTEPSYDCTFVRVYVVLCIVFAIGIVLMDIAYRSPTMAASPDEIVEHIVPMDIDVVIEAGDQVSIMNTLQSVDMYAKWVRTIHIQHDTDGVHGPIRTFKGDIFDHVYHPTLSQHFIVLRSGTCFNQYAQPWQFFHQGMPVVRTCEMHAVPLTKAMTLFHKGGKSSDNGAAYRQLYNRCIRLGMLKYVNNNDHYIPTCSDNKYAITVRGRAPVWDDVERDSEGPVTLYVFTQYKSVILGYEDTSDRKVMCCYRGSGTPHEYMSLQSQCDAMGAPIISPMDEVEKSGAIVMDYLDDVEVGRIVCLDDGAEELCAKFSIVYGLKTERVERPDTSGQYERLTFL